MSKCSIKVHVALLLVGAYLAYNNAYGAGYLTVTGPVAIRFEMAKLVQRLPVFPHILQSDNDNITNLTAAIETTNRQYIPDLSLHNKPLTEAERAWLRAISPVLYVVRADGDLSDLLPANDELPLSALVSASSANDLLVVTPQMLVDYFKPNKGSSNGVSTTVLVPVNFKPPANAVPQSSQATYRTP